MSRNILNEVEQLSALNFKMSEIFNEQIKSALRPLASGPTLPTTDGTEEIAALQRYLNKPVQTTPNLQDLTPDQQKLITDFIQQANNKKYTATALAVKKPNEIKITTKNGVPIWIAFQRSGKNRIYCKVPTYKKNPTANTNIKQTLINAGYEIGENAESNSELSVTYYDSTNPESFWNLVELIERMGSEFRTVSSSGSARQLVSRPMSNRNYYLGAAALIYVANRFGLPHLLSRGGREGEGREGLFDINDKLITIGQTRRANQIERKEITSDILYREHAVPVNVIVRSAIEMWQDKKWVLNIENLAEVAAMIQRNLVIVLCSGNEAQILDRQHRQTMPENWNAFTGNPLQRFHDAGITVYPLTGGTKRFSE